MVLVCNLLLQKYLFLESEYITLNGIWVPKVQKQHKIEKVLKVQNILNMQIRNENATKYENNTKSKSIKY